MTTNLHDKMLAAIDAYFSASDGTEAEVAENLLLDVRDEINKQHRKAVQDAIVGGTGITKGGERIDPASIYAEPKIGCVNHDCDQCKAVQEPWGYLEIDDIESQREYPHNCRNVNLWHEGGEGMTAIYIAPPVAQPAPVQEPVAWGIIASNTGRICQVELDADEVEGHNPKHIVPLYAAPQPVPVKTYHDGKPWPVAPKPWVGLTEEEIVWLVPGLLDCLCDPYDCDNSGDPHASIRKDMVRLGRAIEAKLKGKNHDH